MTSSPTLKRRDRVAPAQRGGRHGRLRWLLVAWLASAVLISGASRAAPDAAGAPEYALKAAILYNFALFTEWPRTLGHDVVLCVLGSEAFGPELDALNGEPVGDRALVVRRLSRMDPLIECNLVFIAGKAQGVLPSVLASLAGRPVLTVAESPGAAEAGVGINMGLEASRLSFEINLKVVRASGLQLSSKLLRLAGKVYE